MYNFRLFHKHCYDSHQCTELNLQPYYPNVSIYIPVFKKIHEDIRDIRKSFPGFVEIIKKCEHKFVPAYLGENKF